MNTTLGNRLWVGIDLAQDSFEAAVCPEGFQTAHWRTLECLSFTNDAQGRRRLANWLRGQRLAGLVVESTGALSARLADALSKLDLPRPVIINPHFALAFAKSLGVREKTDRTDARTLAAFAATHRPVVRRELSATQRELRELSRQRQALVEQRGAWRDRRRQALSTAAKRSATAVVKALGTQIDHLTDRMRALIAEDPELARQRRLLTTVPGIGPLIAMILLAEFADLRDWSRAEIVAYAGLFPREHTSGTSVRRPARLAKGGGGPIRRALYLAAMSLMRGRTALAGFAARLCERGKTKMCALGALMRKILLVARAVVRTDRPYEEALIGT